MSCVEGMTPEFNDYDLANGRDEENGRKEPIIKKSLQNIGLIIHFSGIDFIEELAPHKGIKN